MTALEEAQARAAAWNAEHPVGTPVIVTMDDGARVETRTRSQAWALVQGDVLVSVEGIAGGYLLDRVAYDPVRELGELLGGAGARVTIDAERCITAPCVLCGTTDRPRELVHVGVYTRRMGGNLRPGDTITRPMCGVCRAATEGP